VGQSSQNVLRATRSHEGRDVFAGEKALGDRHDLFSQQNAKQADQGDDRRRRGADADHAIDNPDEKPGAE
jgi:hypothetical protein